MSLFRIVKYSSILFFLGKYKSKLFRVIAVLLFALITSLLYQDVADYLQRQHPDTVIYALIGKIIIVYGALLFVLWQFRPEPAEASGQVTLDRAAATEEAADDGLATAPNDRLSALEDVGQNTKLRSRYEQLLSEGKPEE